MKIYAIVEKNANGPRGHGEPPNKYIALYHDGEYGEIGRIAPLFQNKDHAEEHRKTLDEYGFYEVVELRLFY